jgi:hypothetical protein
MKTPRLCPETKFVKGGVRQAQPLRLKSVFVVGAGLASPFAVNDDSYPIWEVYFRHIAE